jgi:hypothetical protein
MHCDNQISQFKRYVTFYRLCRILHLIIFDHVELFNRILCNQNCCIKLVRQLFTILICSNFHQLVSMNHIIITDIQPNYRHYIAQLSLSSFPNSLRSDIRGLRQHRSQHQSHYKSRRGQVKHPVFISVKRTWLFYWYLKVNPMHMGQVIKNKLNSTQSCDCCFFMLTCISEFFCSS